MPTSVIDSSEFDKIKQEQARLIKELARMERQRDMLKHLTNHLKLKWME